MCNGVDPEPWGVVFHKDGEKIGELSFNDAGELSFNGKADESAQIFFDSVIRASRPSWDVPECKHPNTDHAPGMQRASVWCPDCSTWVIKSDN